MGFMKTSSFAPGFGEIVIDGDLIHDRNEPLVNTSGSVKFEVRKVDVTALNLHVRDIINGLNNDLSGPSAVPEELNLNVLSISARKLIENGGKVHILEDGIPNFWSSSPKMTISEEVRVASNIYMGAKSSAPGTGVVIVSNDAGNRYEIDASAANAVIRADIINAETGFLDLRVYDLFSGTVRGNVNIFPSANSINISALYGNSFVYNPWDDSVKRHYAYNDSAKAGGLGSFVNPDNAKLVTWYFDNLSHLQLVLEDTAFDPLNPEAADALFKLNSFDATGVTANMDAAGKSKLEVLVDIKQGANNNLRRIKLIEADYINIGDYLDLVDLHYYNDSSDYDRKVQGNLIIEDCGTGKKCLYAVLDFIRPLQRIVRDAKNGWDKNADQMAAAFDAFIYQRFSDYNKANAGSELDLDVNNINLVFAGMPEWMQRLFVGDRIDSDGDTFFDGDGIYSAEELIRENSPASRTPQAALDFVKPFGPGWGAEAARAAHMSSELFRIAFEQHLVDEEHWVRRASDKTAWANFARGSDSRGSALGIIGGFDSKISRRSIVGGFGGVSRAGAGDFAEEFGVGVGAYGMYHARPLGRLYAMASADYHIMRASGMDLPAVGAARTEFGRLDFGFQGGLMHRIYQNYVRGRGYAGVKKIGEWNADIKTHMGKIMQAKQEAAAVPYAGYEISLAKDIQIDDESWMKAFAKIGAEYRLAAPSSDTAYRFIGANEWFDWTDANPLSDGFHARYGVGLEYNRGMGIGLVLSYDRVGEINIFRVGGKYRFCTGRCRMPEEIDAEMLREEGAAVGRTKSENEIDYGIVPNEIRESIKHYGLPPRQEWHRRRRRRQAQQDFD